MATAQPITCLAAVADRKSIAVVSKIALTIMSCVISGLTLHASGFLFHCWFYFLLLCCSSECLGQTFILLPVYQPTLIYDSFKELDGYTVIVLHCTGKQNKPVWCNIMKSTDLEDRECVLSPPIKPIATDGLFETAAICHATYKPICICH